MGVSQSSAVLRQQHPLPAAQLTSYCPLLRHVWHAHLCAQPGLDAVLAEAMHAGGHSACVLDDACKAAGTAGRGRCQVQCMKQVLKGAGCKAAGEATAVAREASRRWA